MKCDICEKSEATIHIQEVVNNNNKSMHICEKCAKKYGFSNELVDIGFHLINFLQNFKPLKKNNKNIINKKNKKDLQPEDESIIRCSQCNTTYDDFLRIGKLGCAFCYTAFREHIKPIIRRIHGKIIHKGNVPEKYRKQLKSERNLLSLNNRLKSAVKREDFETAADIRDEVKKIKSRMEKINAGI